MKNRKRRLVFFLILAIAVGGLAGCGTKAVVWNSTPKETAEGEKQDAVCDTKKEQEIQSADRDESEKASLQAEKILIYICGAVANPGVYELPPESRIIQAIDAAGGLLENADPFHVNQAKKLEDGEQIRILTREEAEAVPLQAGEDPDSAVREEKVNINTADEQTLMTLPGIGQSRAAAIIDYRTSQGAFGSIEDIMKIPGIKESIFSKMKDKISVN